MNSNDFVFTLNEEQQQAKESIVNWFKYSDDKFFLLSGYAGTGKTFCTGAILRELDTDAFPLCVAAPTHKAKKVIRETLDKYGIDANFMTLHRLLGVKLVRDTEGNESFIKDNTINSTVDKYKLIIVDECSMINISMWEWLQYEVRTKCLLLGDKAQLPPINEELARPFQVVPQESSAMLTKVMRYDSGIAELALEIRERLDYPKLFTFLDARGYLDNENDLLVHEETDFKIILDVQAKKLEMELGQTDTFKLMAWTNRVVDYYNHRMRIAKFGLTAKEYILGEIVVARKPIIDNEEIIYPTATELQIEGILELDLESSIENLPAYILQVTDGEKRSSICVLSKAGKKQYNILLENYRQSALAEKDQDTRSSIWRQYFKLKYAFSELRPIFASTIHTMQGSSCKYAFIAIDDISNNEKVREKNQLLYTAVTRAREQVIFLKPKGSS